jgi:hypothetical protein
MILKELFAASRPTKKADVDDLEAVNSFKSHHRLDYSGFSARLPHADTPLSSSSIPPRPRHYVRTLIPRSNWL